jgi:hypothetical protein
MRSDTKDSIQLAFGLISAFLGLVAGIGLVVVGLAMLAEKTGVPACTL